MNPPPIVAMYVSINPTSLLFAGLNGLLGMVSLVCFVLVLTRMFHNDQTFLAILCIVLTFCMAGVGLLIAFVFGWLKAEEWRLRTVMLVWSICGVVHLVSGGWYLMVHLAENV
ncbi:MAG: hypothetical protein ACK4RK_09345 [Gemmataceae bacterium]